jgi:hypothetical protein
MTPEERREMEEAVFGPTTVYPSKQGLTCFVCDSTTGPFWKFVNACPMTLRLRERLLRCTDCQREFGEAMYWYWKWKKN